MPTIGLLSVGILWINGPVALGISMTAPVRARTPIAAQAADAGSRLVSAANAVAAAQDSLDAASSRLPAVQQQLDTAKAASVAAQQTQVHAVAAATQAQSAVVAQQVKVDQSTERINETHQRVDSLARQEYMSGGSAPYEIEILLGTQDPAAFGARLQAFSRSSRSNGKALDDLAAAQQLQRHELATLNAVKATAVQTQLNAEHQAQVAEIASQSATNAQNAVTALVAQRQSELTSVSKQRAEVATLYRSLLTQQRAEIAAAAKAQAAAEAAAKRKAAEDAKHQTPTAGETTGQPAKPPPTVPVAVGAGGYVSTVGTGRSAKAAIAWALSMVGSGRDYHNMCLRFVDDAYSVSHGRTGSAIGQWTRAVSAGYGHRGDRNPPIGAQVFWQTSNPARHIALYAGGGMVISSDADSGAVGFVPMSQIDRWGPYLGWATPFYP